MYFPTRVYTLVYMAIKNVDINRCLCDKCGYEWMSLKIPATCANKKCRSPRWNNGEFNNPPTPVYTKNVAVPSESPWTPTGVNKQIQDTFPQHIKDTHPEWNDKKDSIKELKELMNSIQPRESKPATMEQFDLTEPTLHYD